MDDGTTTNLEPLCPAMMALMGQRVLVRIPRAILRLAQVARYARDG